MPYEEDFESGVKALVGTAPRGLIGRQVFIEIGSGAILTTVLSVSTVANDDGYLEIGVAQGLYRGDTIFSIVFTDDRTRTKVRYRSSDGKVDWAWCEVSIRQ